SKVPGVVNVHVASVLTGTTVASSQSSFSGASNVLTQTSKVDDAEEFVENTLILYTSPGVRLDKSKGLDAQAKGSTSASVHISSPNTCKEIPQSVLLRID